MSSGKQEIAAKALPHGVGREGREAVDRIITGRFANRSFTSRAVPKQMLEDIQTGRYAKGWIAENEAGRPTFNTLREADRNHQIEQVGAKLRQMMPFLKPIATEDTVGAR